MKTLFRVLTLAVLLTAFSTLSFAQDDLATLFERFKTEAKGKCGERDAALATGKTIIEKFGSDELNKDVIDFVKKRMATIEKEDPRCKLNARYDTTYKAKDWANFFAVSKEIIAAEGDSPLALDLLLTNVSVGFNLADRDKVDTYNNDTLNWAKTALQKIQAGKASQTGKWGVFEPFGNKDAAQSWANFTIGYLMYNKLNQKNTEALSYFYKSTQVSNEKKNDTTIYTNIGTYFFNKAQELDTGYREARKTNNNEDNDETKRLLGLARGNADRAIDAFGRAYKIAAADPKKAELKTTIGKTLSDLYKFRFNLADAKQPDIDKYVADLVAKPMPDPSTEVTPVVIEAPATTTTTTSTTTTTTTPTTTTTSTTKEATKPTTTKETTTATTNTTKTKTPAKKPAPKKKGTR